MGVGYLIHHGIKGQKWGVRNGPPYPLKDSVKRKAYSKDQRGTSKRNSKKNFMNSTVGSIDPKKIQMGIAMAAPFVMLGVAKLSANIQHDKDVKKNKESNTTNIQKRIKGRHSEAEDMKAVNPGFKTGERKYTMNCVLCSTAYELRRRGYDVEANTTELGRYMEDPMSYFNLRAVGAKFSTRSYDELKSKLQREPEGARGNIISGVGNFDSRHSMVWEKKNGDIIIRDCQSNTLYNSIDESIIRSKSRYEYEYIRTDNATINWDAIRDAVVERK